MPAYTIELDNNRKVQTLTVRDLEINGVLHTYHCDISEMCEGRRRDPSLVHLCITNYDGFFYRKHVKPEDLPEPLRGLFENQYSTPEKEGVTP